MRTKVLSPSQITRNAVASCSKPRQYGGCRRISTGLSPNRTARSSSHAKRESIVHNSFYLGSRRSFHSSPPSSKDPYNVLGVSKDASSSDIKKAYFQLAKKYHPDTNKDPASKERFLEIQNAYEILGDDQKKQAYDTYGEASQQPGFDQNPFGAGNPFAGAGGFSRGFAGSGGTVEDLFSSLFGGGPMSGRARASTRGDDIEISISVSFMEAAKGTQKTVNVTPVSDCSTCTGTGMKTGKKRTQCPTCRGTGQQTFVLNSGFQMASTCSTCQGAGSTIPRGAECDDCGGVGKIKYRKQVKIEVPAGVEDGMTVRVPGEGDAPMSTRGSNGDLLVRVNVSSSNVWRRQGTNLYYDAPIPLHTAVLGGRIRVPTLDGEVEVRVAPGTQPGEDAVLRGRGVQSVMQKGMRGDLFISYMVQIPRNMSRRQKELMQQFADEVEGRTPAQTTNSSSSSTGSTTKSSSTSAPNPPSPSAAGPGSSAGKDDGKDRKNDDGGEATTSPPLEHDQPAAASPGSSWTKKLKGLLGMD